MTRPNSITKEFSSSRGDRLIQALIANPKGFSATTFSEAAVERVTEMAEERSALVLRSGTEIPVAISYEQLVKRIYQPDFKNDGPVLDLRNVTGEAAKLRAPANTNRAATPGDKMQDGSVFAGISPDTHKPMYATPTDASLTMNFNQAREYAAKLDAHGHKDWRVPTKAELNVMFNNRAAVDGFNVSGSIPAGLYWSASPTGKGIAWFQNFSEGVQSFALLSLQLPVRLVR
jgi:Protein of unknown function (DUF1566)